MTFTTIPTEQTSATTDLLIALLALGCIVYLRRDRTLDPWKVDLWSWTYGLLAVGAGVGAAGHGIDTSPAVYARLNQALFLSLGLVVALFVVAAVYDWRGPATARRGLPLMLAVGVAFFGITRIITGTFLIFVIYEAIAMIAALAIYAGLARQRRLAGAAIIAVAVLLNIIAAAIQASRAVSFHFIWPFDHNGVFHIVQMIAILVLVVGLQHSLSKPSGQVQPATAR